MLGQHKQSKYCTANTAASVAQIKANHGIHGWKHVYDTEEKPAGANGLLLCVDSSNFILY